MKKALQLYLLFWSLCLTVCQGNQGGSSMVLPSPKETDPYLTNQVKNTILKRASQLQSCYLDHLKRSPEVEKGNVKVDWQITRQGRVIQAEVVTSDFRNSAFEKCLIGKLRSWLFPPPDREARYVAHTFQFKKDEPVTASAKDVSR